MPTTLFGLGDDVTGGSIVDITDPTSAQLWEVSGT
jgi:hypothetical protein